MYQASQMLLKQEVTVTHLKMVLKSLTSLSLALNCSLDIKSNQTNGLRLGCRRDETSKT